jgi:hypothetical protein
MSRVVWAWRVDRFAGDEPAGDHPTNAFMELLRTEAKDQWRIKRSERLPNAL